MPREEVEFQTIKAELVKFGNNNFIEVARKRAVTEERENVFISVSRGFFLPDGTKRFKTSLTVPDEEEVKDFVSKTLLEI